MNGADTTGEVAPEDGLKEQESLWATVKGDFANSGGFKIVAVALVLAWMAFQWGWGNDILLPPIVARAFESVDDGTTWLSAVLATLAGTGAGMIFWGLTQTIDGVVVLTGLRLLPGITARISRFVGRQGWIKPYDQLTLRTKFLIAYLSGASVLCLADVFATGTQGLNVRRRMLAEAVGLAVAGVGLIILVIGVLTSIGARIPATEGAAEVAVRYAKNPLTWLAIYGTLFGLSALASKITGEPEAE